MPLQGLALPVETWERDVLPRRTGAYSQTWLDALCASGELVWVGAGALGRSRAGGALLPRGRAGDRPARRARRRSAAPRRRAEHELIRARLARGARPSSPTCSPSSTRPPEALREALWDLVWAGRGDERRVGAAARAAARARARPGLRPAARAPRRALALRLAAQQRAPSPRCRAAGR